MEASPLFAFYNTGDVSDVEAFNNMLLPLLNILRNRTASGNSSHKFALQSAPAPNFQTIYAFLECTPDLSKLECNSCLQQVQIEPPPSPLPPSPSPPPLVPSAVKDKIC
ncbi:cysteine-rich receptor-like protein kinase 26 [Quercus suber]|uniref:Cysteine-rich receptor-like protein kinase 26 n=1 Tax=Quercus suber TaxID=58331 RepID=A0AAW0MG04_QUESU